MRVLFWSAAFWPKIGGVEVHAAKLLLALKARGYEFVVLTTLSDPTQPETDLYHGIPVCRLPFWSRTSYGDVDVLMRIRQKVAALKRLFTPDLVHINAIDAGNFFHLLTAHVGHAPVLVTLHGEWPSRHDEIARQILNTAVWVVGCSQAILNKGRELAPEIISRSSVIHNGLEAPTAIPKPLPAVPRLLCLGRLSPEKGFDLAIKAFAAVIQHFPQARLKIAGDGSARAELQRQALKEGIEHHVDFLGWVDNADVASLINASTMVLMPSRRESLPLVALEAALMARPVIATRIGGLPEVVQHRMTGLLVESEDPQSLGDAISFLLRQSALATEMGNRAKSRANRLFSWKNHVDGYDALYRNLATETGIPGSNAIA